ncbi:hypothetical protein F0U60_20030 [Archangium minus]|uniref:ParB/Sulfiredoxin domain-containing protein n=1 Tax=Archangium minus TaxID=83450 RepID=A0ABY9WVC1_9BACT|nr:hypothetical protein F0U60_20030 [Archangium minus]
MSFMFTELNELSAMDRLKKHTDNPQPLSEILLYYLSPICPPENYSELFDISLTIENEMIRKKIMNLTLTGAPTRQNNAYYKTLKECSPHIIDTKNVLPPLHRLGAIYDDRKLSNVLNGIQKGVPLPPITVKFLKDHKTHEYEIVDGIHRYYASVKQGFGKLPVKHHQGG